MKRFRCNSQLMTRLGRVFVVLAIALTGCAKQDTADLLIVGGTIYTMDPDRPTVEAVAVRREQIMFAGPRARALRYQGPRTLVLDISGQTMIPGLVDSHAHLMSLGQALSELDLVGTASADTVRQLVVETNGQTARGAWVHGRGWDQNDWEVKAFPTWRDLGGSESNPVFLRRIDGHAAWLNRTALDSLGITAETPDPFGGRIVRDDQGEPTGILIDRAMDQAYERLPRPSIEEKTRRMRLAVDECLRFGLTGVHDAQTTRDALAVLRQLDRHRQLGIRVYAMLDSSDSTFVETAVRAGVSDGGQSRVTVRAIKVYADGALGSRGAALLAPYRDDPANVGLMRNSVETIEYWTRLALENGFQICIHAIGDAANRAVIDIYERQIRASRVKDPRCRIEHAQVLAIDDIDRLAPLGIIASMQPTHATSDMYWAEERLGPERIRGAYAWRKLIDSGVTIVCGSDFPVEAVNPLLGIYAAVTRQDVRGWPEGGWYPEERMTIDEAVRGFTANAAFAAFAEDWQGTIEIGKGADFTIVDRDIFQVAPAQILDTEVVYTIVGGMIRYAAKENLAVGDGGDE